MSGTPSPLISPLTVTSPLKVVSLDDRLIAPPERFGAKTMVSAPANACASTSAARRLPAPPLFRFVTVIVAIDPSLATPGGKVSQSCTVGKRGGATDVQALTVKVLDR